MNGEYVARDAPAASDKARRDGDDLKFFGAGRPSPFARPDASVTLPDQASAVMMQPYPPNQPSRVQPKTRPAQQCQQQQQQQQRAGGGFRRWFACCGAPPMDDAAPPPLVARDSLPLRLPQTSTMQSNKACPASQLWGQVSRKSTSSFTDAEWCDAKSELSWLVSTPSLQQDTAQLAQLEQLAAAPDPPLYFQDGAINFVPIPEHIPFAGYWLRDSARTTPSPQPIDVLLRSNWLTRKVHDSIPGIYLKETATTLEVRARPGFSPPGLPLLYVETYNKDGSESMWRMRRDLVPGRSFGRMFMSADGMLVFRTYTKGIISDDIDTIAEEYMRLEYARPPTTSGTQQQQQQQQQPQVIVAKQCCYHVPSQRTAVQYLVGHWRPAPAQ